VCWSLSHAAYGQHQDARKPWVPELQLVKTFGAGSVISPLGRAVHVGVEGAEDPARLQPKEPRDGLTLVRRGPRLCLQDGLHSHCHGRHEHGREVRARVRYLYILN
jgi:hypothetical protein